MPSSKSLQARRCMGHGCAKYRAYLFAQGGHYWRCLGAETSTFCLAPRRQLNVRKCICPVEIFTTFSLSLASLKAKFFSLHPMVEL